MANVFTSMPIYLDTDTSTGGGTNWRGASGGQLLNPNIKGILPTNLVLSVVGTLAAGAITITDPQQSTGVLLKISITTASVFPIELAASGGVWRDFVVTGLTATGTAIEIYYSY